MPENETMVAAGRTSARWRSLKERLDLGADPIALFAEIQGEFHGAVRGILSRWKRHGVDQAAFFEAAAIDRAASREMARKLGPRDYARSMGDVIASRPGADRDGLICGWVEEVWERIRGQLQVDRHEWGPRVEFEERVARMLAGISGQLCEDPSRIPRRPPRGRRPDVDDYLGFVLSSP